MRRLLLLAVLLLAPSLAHAWPPQSGRYPNPGGTRIDFDATGSAVAVQFNLTKSPTGEAFVLTLNNGPLFAGFSTKGALHLGQLATGSLPATCRDGDILWDTTAAAHKKCVGNAWSALGTGGTTYSAGGGLKLVGTTLSLNDALTTNGQVLRWYGGAWSGYTIPTYTAGVGLQLTTGAFALVQCPDGQVLRAYNNGNYQCADVSYSAGAGLKLTGSVLALNDAGVSTGQYLQKSAGGWAAAWPAIVSGADGVTATNIGSGQVSLSLTACPNGYSRVWDAGKPMCEPNGGQFQGFCTINIPVQTGNSCLQRTCPATGMTSGTHYITASINSMTSGTTNLIREVAGGVDVVNFTVCNWRTDSSTTATDMVVGWVAQRRNRP